MRRISFGIGSWSLATRQFLLLFLATFLMLGFLAYDNYQKAATLFREQMLDDSWKLIARTNDYIDSYLDNGQNILLLLSDRTDLLTAGDKEAEDYLRSVAGYNSTIVKSLYMIRSDGKVYSNAQLTYDIVGNPALPELYEQSQQNYGASAVSQPYPSPLSGRTVAISRPMTEQGRGVVGVAVVELDLEKLRSKLAELTSGGYQAFLLQSDKGNVVTFDPDSDMLPHKPRTYMPELPDDFAAAMFALPAGTSDSQGADGRLTVVKSGMNRLGWSLIVFIKDRYFHASIIRLYDNYKSAAVIWTAVLLIVTFAMSKYLTRPIRILAAKMDRVRDMEVLPRITVDRRDEIGRLARSYQSMMERIRILLNETKQMEQRKKELELKVLQSQIAPHFLYNTLACIGSLARQHKTDEVKETIRSLVGLLSLSFDRTNEFVTVAEELEGLRMYLQIQNIRYGSKFQCVTNVPAEAAQTPILKLTLQPIVENAIFHGIMPRRGNGTIFIRATIRRGVLRFYVRDDGVGMDAEAARRLLGDPLNPAPKERFTGIGLSNVHDRLRLHYGEPYGLRIKSVKEIGTIVCIQLPF